MYKRNATFKIFYTSLLILTSSGLWAQQKKENYTHIKKFLGASVSFPVGSFANTHFAGAGAGYSITLNRENQVLNLVFDAGATYYLGKRETISLYRYKYPGFTSVYIMGGAYCYAGNFDIRLLAGPALGIYNGNTRFNISWRFEANYETGSAFYISPILSIMKEPGAKSLLSAGLKVMYEL